MSGRCWWSAAIGIAAVLGLATPAVAGETTFDDTCADVYGKRPIGDLEKTTDPAVGSSVVPGHRVTVTLQWPTFGVAGERAHRVMECLSVDGGEPQLWAERQFTTADGTVTLSAVVPAGPRQSVCSQSFLKTEGSFGPVTRWSEKTCYPVGQEGTFTALARSPSPPSASSPPEPGSRSTPTTRGRLFPPKDSPSSPSPPKPPAGSGEYRAPWPPWEEGPESAAPPTTATGPKAAAATPRRAQGQQAATAPAEQAPAQAPSQTLPKTGAGIVVLLGVAAVALFSGRTLRRTANHIEENLPVEAVPVGDDAEPTLILGRRW